MDYVKVLSDLIAIDTTVPPGRNYDRAMDFLQPLFAGLGFATQKVPIPAENAEGREGRVCLIAHRREPGKPRLIFYGHVDVVPAEGWPAFAPRVENGRIYGRGAADMKGSIAALLLALDGLKGKALNYDTSVMITTDEELSQASQLEYIRPFLEPVSGASFFDLDSSFGYVSIAGLGALHIDIRVTGKSVHSAMSHLGVNAVESAVPLMEALLKLKRRVVRRRSAVPANPDTGLTRMVARLNINKINGGLKVNIVPDSCTIVVDRRLIPEEDLAQARQEIEDALKAVPGVQWEFERVFSIPCVPPRQGPVIDHLAGIIKDVTGKTGQYGEMGSGDLGHIVSGWGGQEFGLGVIRPDNSIHGMNEFVYCKDIEDLAEIIKRFVTT